MKLCSKCKQEKQETDFHRNANYCKSCKKQYNKENQKSLKEKRKIDYIKNKTRDDLRNKQYYQEKKEERKQYYEDNKSRFHDHYIKASYGSSDKQIMVLVNRTKQRALRNKLNYDIDFDFINSLFKNQNGKCLLTGIDFDLEKPQKTSIRPFSMSLDRIIPELGYMQTNVRLVCSIVNLALNEFGLDSFDKMCQSYYQRKKTE